MSIIRLASAPAAGLLLAVPVTGRAQTIQLSYPASAHAGPITGRAFVFIARTDKTEPRRQAGTSTTP